MSLTRAIAILLIGLSLLISARAEAGTTISVDASPLSIPADGKSYSQVLVTLIGPTGSPASDDTEVRLTTSAGDITPVVYSTGGRAVGILTSSSSPQIAVVTAMADGASSSVQVEFAAPDQEGVAAGGGTIRMEGGSLAYAVDQDTVLGSNSVTMEYKGMTIRAVSAQVCQASGLIRAQGDVSVEKDGEILTADALACDVRDDRILLLDRGDESLVRGFDVRKLRPIAPEKLQTGADAFSPLMSTNSSSWIVCGRLVLIPGQKILFFKASIYVGDSKVITLPCYVYSYQTRESILHQVRYTSRDGMLVDLPFYYRATDSGTGALKLRYAADGTEMGSYYSPRKGMSIGLDQDYALGDRSQGRVFIDSVASSSLAFETAHHLEFGTALIGGRADVSMRYQPASSYAKDVYSTSVNVLGSLRNYNYTLSGYLGGSRFEQYNYLDPETMEYVGQSTCSVRTVFRPNSPIIARGLGRLSPSLTVAYGNLWDASAGSSSTVLYQSLGLSFNRSNPIGRRTTFNLDGAMGLTLTARGDTGAGLRLRPTLTNNWLGGSASLSYTLNLQGGATDSGWMLGRHELGCNLYLSGSKWSSSIYANYGLDSGRLNLYSTLGYRIARQWRIRSSYNLYRYAYEMSGSSYSYSNSYLKVGIYRPLGSYEIGLAWSPNGQNYGVDKGKRIWLELGGRGF